MTDRIIDSAPEGESDGSNVTVSFEHSGAVVFRAEEVWEFGLYEEGKEVDLDFLLTCVLERRMRSFVLPFCIYTKRTEKQIEDKLRGQFCEKNGYGGIWKEYIDGALQNVLEYLKSEGYAGDETYCDAYFRSRSDKDVSATQIVSELVRRGIPAGIAEDAASRSGRDDSESCRRALEKKMRSRSGRKPGADAGGANKTKEKAAMVRFLISRGFDTGLAVRTVEEYGPYGNGEGSGDGCSEGYGGEYGGEYDGQ